MSDLVRKRNMTEEDIKLRHITHLGVICLQSVISDTINDKIRLNNKKEV